MEEERNISFDQLITAVAQAIAKMGEILGDPASNPSRLILLLRELGWNLAYDTSVGGTSLPLVSAANALSGAVTGNNIEISSLFQSMQEVLNARSSLVQDLGLEAENDLLQAMEDELPRQLLDYAVIRFLQDEFPTFYGILSAAGIIIQDYLEPDTSYRLGHIKREIRWNIAINMIREPKRFFEFAYGWGTSYFNGGLLLDGIEAMLLELGLDVGRAYHPRGGDEFTSAAAEPVRINIIDSDDVQLGLDCFIVGNRNSTDSQGFGVAPFIAGDTNIVIHITDGLSLVLEASALDLPGVGFKIIPSGIIFFSDAGISTLAGRARLAFRIHPEGGLGRLGEADGSRIEVGSICVSLQAAVENEEINISVELRLEDLGIHLTTEGADGFLAKLLSGIKLGSELDLTIGWASNRGMYIQGNGALEISTSIHRTLGPLLVKEVYLSVSITDGKVPIAAAVSFAAELGPVFATVKRVGFVIRFPIGDGFTLNDIEFGFLPPTGAGLAIDAGPVTGGGYVEFDNENKRYAGILQLAFGDIGLTAIGLITTRMPDGSKDFSMLVIIGVEFDPPISLPYNFNLSGVGGLLGIKRSMNVDYLREGLKQGTLDSVLFPQDPILNAPRIISDLRAGFPPTKDRYIIGPMAIIGWGNPLIIRAEIGIFIEVPSPVRIAILGQIAAQLPNAEEDTETIVVIHLDILGVLDFEKQSFSLDATIYDSRILQFALSGDMAMRLYWGDPPFFLTSFGGFNPKFKVRPGTPVLRRMMLSIGKGDNPRLSLECYMALTSNTTQFGAKLELTARKAGFKVHGYLYFHALFIFSPFSFVIDMGAGVEVYKGSRCLLCISLDFTLSGPTPWRAKGTGKFKILLLKVKVRFDKSWGKRQSPSLPATDPWWLLKEALENRGNWKGLLPGEKEQVIRLKKIEDTEVTVAVHPKGRLEISQNVLPFNLILQKFGNGPISGDDAYWITELQINEESVDIGKLNYVKDYFAKAQFIKMSDAEKLSRPSFEKEDANILIGSDDIRMGPAVKYDLEYETEVIDENKVTHSLELTPVLWQFGGVLLHGRAKRESSPAAKKFRRSDLEPLVGLAEEQYRVVTKDSLNSVTEAAASYSQAQYLMQGFLESHPEQDGNVQIISK